MPNLRVQQHPFRDCQGFVASNSHQSKNLYATLLLFGLQPIEMSPDETLNFATLSSVVFLEKISVWKGEFCQIAAPYCKYAPFLSFSHVNRLCKTNLYEERSESLVYQDLDNVDPDFLSGLQN